MLSLMICNLLIVEFGNLHRTCVHDNSLCSEAFTIVVHVLHTFNFNLWDFSYDRWVWVQINWKHHYITLLYGSILKDTCAFVLEWYVCLPLIFCVVSVKLVEVFSLTYIWVFSYIGQFWNIYVPLCKSDMHVYLWFFVEIVLRLWISFL